MGFAPTAMEHELPAALLDSRFAQTVVALPSGAQVAVRMAGQGSTVVLLHGIGSGAPSWLDCALALSTQARVVAWDAPGYGISTPLESRAPAAADYADRLGELLCALKIQSCVLVGHSLGALTAVAFAQRSGSAVVRRLVLISPARGYGAPDQADASQAVLATRLQDLLRQGIDGMAQQAPTRTLSAQANPAARAWVQWNAARLNPDGYTQAVRMLCGDDIARYADVAMPVEVHCGDADTVTTPQACRAVAQRFGAPFELIAHAGHASPVEQPASVARLIACATTKSFGDHQQ